jgi:hypothetical protein
MGTDNIRLNSHGRIDFRLKRQIAGYKRRDPPPNRIKPIPIQILRHIITTAYATDDPCNHAIADMIIITFFFLLHPGKYMGTASDTCPFRLIDVQLWIGSLCASAASMPLANLAHATFGMLMFMTQKNGVHGEVIRLGHSGNPLFCPVLAFQHQVTHLHQHHLPPDTPLATYVHRSCTYHIAPAHITATLCASTALLGPSLGFLPSEINAHSLCATGAMALLCTHVDSNIICLLGRWRSDQMLCYLHIQVEPIM